MIAGLDNVDVAIRRHSDINREVKLAVPGAECSDLPHEVTVRVEHLNSVVDGVRHVDLSGTVYSIRFFFNRRADRWFCDVYDVDGNILRAGLKLVCNQPIFLDWIQQGRPLGEIIAIDPATDVDPGLDELGSRVFVTYNDGLG